MAEPLVVAVFSPAGPQGSSVARALTCDPNIRVRAICHDVFAEKSQQLVDDGVEYEQCNLEDVYSIAKALDGVDACFVVTDTNFEDPSCKENEIRRGRLIADACAMAGVKHVVFSTQLHAKRMLAIEVPHLDAKALIGEYMMEKHLPLTCVMVPCYYEHFLGLFRPLQWGPNDYRISLPIGLAPLDLVCLDDVGEVVRQVLLNRDTHLHKTVSVCGDKLTVKEIAGILSTHLKPKVFREKQVSVNEYKMQSFPGVRDWANMFYFFSRVDQKYNVASTRRINPHLKSFDQWVSRNADIIHRAMES